MEVKVTLDLEAAVASALSPEHLQPLLDKAIAESIKDAINGATGYNSPFRKAVTEQLQTALPHGLHLDDVAKFQQVLNAALTAAVRGVNQDAVDTALKIAAERSLGFDVPARIKLSELLKLARDEFSKEPHESFYAELEPLTYGGGYLLFIGSDPTKDKYRAPYQLQFNETGNVYSGRFDGMDLTPKSMPTVITKFQSLIMALYVGRTTIEADLDEDGVEDAAMPDIDD